MLSGFTLGIYTAGTVFHRPDQFGGLVDASAVSVFLGFLTYVAWVLLFHEHWHQHTAHSHDDDPHGEHGHGQHDHGGCSHGEHGHSHGHAHHAHDHTSQQ